MNDLGVKLFWLTIFLCVFAWTVGFFSDKSDCFKHDFPVLEKKIAACTIIIDDPTQDLERKAIALNNRGSAQVDLGKFDLAVRDLDEAIKLKPDYHFALNNRGHAFYEIGKHDLAIRDCSLALKVKPDFAPAYNTRGFAKFSKQDTTGAISDFDRAIELDPKFANAFNGRGVALIALGKVDSAIQDFNSAIGLSPKYENAFINRGTAFSKRGLYDRAIQDFDQVIRFNSKSVGGFYQRAITFHLKSMYDAAIADYRQALALQPKNSAIAEKLKLAEDAKAKQLTRLLPSRPRESRFGPAALPAGPKVILIIGNRNYAHLTDLTNPQSDAEAMAAEFRGMGYELVGGKVWLDLDLAGMDAALAAFANAAQGAAAAAIYYGGHGEQRLDTRNELDNFLFPIDASPASAAQTERQAIRLQSVLRAMAGVQPGGLRLAMIDACRSLGKGQSGRGLKRQEGLQDVYVVYATQAGLTAADGSEVGRKNSPFVAGVRGALKTHRTADVTALFREVTRLMRAMPEKQEPEKIDTLAAAPAL